LRASLPVFAAFGEADHIISIEDVQRFRNCLEANRSCYHIHIYDGAPHGWLNDTMPGRYRKPQADAGWAAQQRFLSKVFAGGYDAKQASWRFESERAWVMISPRTCAWSRGIAHVNWASRVISALMILETGQVLGFGGQFVRTWLHSLLRHRASRVS
jgi:hypothetical protein